MQNPTPVTVQSSVIVEVIILFTEHNNPQYFSEEKEQILPLLVQFPEQISPALLLYRKKNKIKAKLAVNSDEQKMAIYIYLKFPSHLSFVQIQCTLKAGIQPTTIIHCSMHLMIIHLPCTDSAFALICYNQ